MVPHDRWARAWQWLGRARFVGGHKLQDLELIGKSALAASASWCVAHDLVAGFRPRRTPRRSPRQTR